MRAEKEAACKGVREACKKDHSNKLKKLEATAQQEQEALAKQHQSAMAEAAEMPGRRLADSEQFAYTVRGHTAPGLPGSIHCQVFEAEPNSVLNRLFNGEWAYACDDLGCACINSDPAHWPLILNWLSFGSIPAQPSAEFMAECKYWQLDNLLTKSEEQRAAAHEHLRTVSPNERDLDLHAIEEGGRSGFLLKGKIHNVMQRFSRNKHVSTPFVAFRRPWVLQIQTEGVFLQNASSSAVKRSILQISFGEDWLADRCDDGRHADKAEEREFEPSGSGWGSRWRCAEDDDGNNEDAESYSEEDIYSVWICKVLCRLL